MQHQVVAVRIGEERHQAHPGVECVAGEGHTLCLELGPRGVDVVDVESRIHVLVLRKPAAQDSRLSGADVAVEDRTVSVLGAAYLNDPEDLNGRTVRRALPAGTTLTVDMLRPDVLVHRGQEVTLIAAAGGLQVRASGRALADGEAGARLKVQNLTSQRVVEGVVESADVVRVQ